jgi:hypothetical protein
VLLMLVELGEEIATFSVETVVPVPDAAPEGPAAVRITVVVLGQLCACRESRPRRSSRLRPLPVATA